MARSWYHHFSARCAMLTLVVKTLPHLKIKKGTFPWEKMDWKENVERTPWFLSLNLLAHDSTQTTLDGLDGDLPSHSNRKCPSKVIDWPWEKRSVLGLAQDNQTKHFRTSPFIISQLAKLLCRLCSFGDGEVSRSVAGPDPRRFVQKKCRWNDNLHQTWEFREIPLQKSLYALANNYMCLSL